VVKNRAGVLASVADPLLLNLWDKCYSKNMKDSVDTVYVKMTNRMEPNVRDFIVNKLTNNGYHVWYQEQADVHGNVLKDLMKEVKEETVILLEDDFFVTSPGVLEPLFLKIERGEVDCIGSTRGCCTTKMTDAIAKTFKLTGNSPEHPISECPNLWPCLFVSKTTTLNKTDGHYAAKQWDKGTVVPYINMYCDEAECGDSFVWTSIQLRGQGNTFAYEHQHHTAPDDLQDFPRRTALFSYNPIPWVHVGSLSSGVAGLLKYDNNVTLSCDKLTGNPTGYPIADPTTILEYSRRLAMFKFIADYGKLEDPSLDYYNKIYNNAVDRAITNMKLPIDIVSKFYKIMQYIFASTLRS